MKSPPRIVLDTNVIVAGLRSRQGWAFQLLSRVGEGAFDHCVSVPLLLEYEEVLKRMAAPLGLESREIDIVLDRLAQTGKKCLIYFQVRPVLPDADDEMVLDLAIAAQVDCIVTFNVRDFRVAERFGIRAATPAEFCAEIGLTP
jgi:putative PIN family toxin of toxin-antitoxin system